MAQLTRPVIEQIDFTGGLNSAEPADQIGTGQVAELINLEYRRARGLKRRRGSVNSLTSPPFAGGSTIVSLFRHTPTTEDSMELWGISNDATPEVGRVAAGSAWAAVSLADAISSAADAWYFHGVSFNGKLYLAYNSAVDRLHVWTAATGVRRAGMATTAAPTVANQGAGAYAAVLRYYKIQWGYNDVNGLQVLSPPSAAVSFTPSGAGLSARVTAPAGPGEGETFWRLLASPDGVNYYVLAGIPLPGLTYDDTTLPSAYAAAVPTFSGYPSGADYYTAPLSGKFLLVDGSQLLMAGSWETASLASTVWYTPALNTTGFIVADDERIPSTNRIDIDPSLGGGITGLGGPIGGTPVVFKFERTYLLNPTSDPTRPYTRQLLSDCVGCVSYQGIVLAEDEQGNPALYWPSRRGYYRYGSGGLEYIGADIEDLWATVNLSAVNGITATYHRDAGQVWILIPTGSQTQPSIRLKFHVARGRRTEEGVRGGWSRDQAAGGVPASSLAMFSDTPGSPMGLRLKPYYGMNGLAVTHKGDADGINQDINVGYSCYFLTRALHRGAGEFFGVQNVYVQAVAESANVTLNVGLHRNFSTTESVPLVPVTLPTTRATVSASGLELSECEVVQLRISEENGAANNHHWDIGRVGIRVRAEAPQE